MLTLVALAASVFASSSLAAPPAAPVATRSEAVPPAPAAATAPAVAASNAFGVDLFRELAKKNTSGNLFISPYSMSVALTMAAEGARAETESEMAAVLRFPKTAPEGSRPISTVHSGYAALARQLDDAAGSADPATRERITALRAKLDEANKRTRELERTSDKWQDAMKSHQEAVQLASELNSLLVSVDRFDLRVANALWVERTYPLSPAYEQVIGQFYGSGAANALNIAGDTEASRQRINGWVEDHTERRIKDLIPKGAMASDTRLVITNAVYFLGQWASPFFAGNTRDAEFTTASGEHVQVPTMNDSWRGGVPYAAFTGTGEYFDTPMMVPVEESKRPPTYPGDDGFQLIEMPYKGGDLSMVLLLPRTASGLPALESKLSAESLSAWLGKLHARTVDTSVPRFKVEFAVEMSEPLKQLGMRRAFVSPELPGGAQFPGMTSSKDLLQQLFIGAVLHKAWVDVNEKGTEAAAATAVMMAPAGAVAQPQTQVPFNPRFNANHPFLFVIRDAKSGVILFIGRVSNPANA